MAWLHATRRAAKEIGDQEKVAFYEGLLEALGVEWNQVGHEVIQCILERKARGQISDEVKRSFFERHAQEIGAPTEVTIISGSTDNEDHTEVQGDTEDQEVPDDEPNTCDHASILRRPTINGDDSANSCIEISSTTCLLPSHLTNVEQTENGATNPLPRPTGVL